MWKYVKKYTTRGNGQKHENRKELKLTKVGYWRSKKKKH